MDTINNRDELNKIETWNKIEQELLAAYNELPEEVVESDEGYRESDFKSYLNAGEWGLALEELEGVIEDNPIPGKKYWKHMMEAAILMKLNSANEYEKFISE